jgi:arginyl-tRNA--protein-N-Asp/Glu arginylyltransferase
MILHQPPSISAPAVCSYHPDRISKTQYFYASDLNETELDQLLSKGWRKFGLYFFRPFCEGCRACIPVRVCISSFSASKSMRRVLSKNKDIRVEFAPDEDITPEIFHIYEEHSKIRFDRPSDIDDFFNSFGVRSCPSLLSKYFLNDNLSAVGFLDRSLDSLSTVYFIYTSEFVCRSPGTFSILQEIAHARSLGLKYYYLGYLVEGNERMVYKARFFPQEWMDWETGEWG